MGGIATLLCRAGSHRPAGAIVSNAGVDFAACAACARPLVRSDGGWGAVPNGYRIAWRPAPARRIARGDGAAERPRLRRGFAAAQADGWAEIREKLSAFGREEPPPAAAQRMASAGGWRRAALP